MYIARIFHFLADNVIITNITFINGKANGNKYYDNYGYGGAIQWWGENGTVSNSTFNNNNAPKYGGAIIWDDENGAVSNSTFNNNAAKYGGAIYWHWKYGDVSSCLFINNTANSDGGAVI